MTQSQRSKSLLELMIAWLHRREGGTKYGKEKNEIMEKNFNCFISIICTISTTNIKKIYNNI